MEYAEFAGFLLYIVRREKLIDLNSGVIIENNRMNDPKWNRETEYSDFEFEGPPDSPSAKAHLQYL